MRGHSKVLVLTFFSLVLLPFCFTVVEAQGQAADTQPRAALVYLAPKPEATFASAGTTITVRNGEAVDSGTVNEGLFKVTGSVSGRHSGEAYLSADSRTVIFRPNIPFTPGEDVSVTVAEGLRTKGQTQISGVTWTFGVSPKSYPYNDPVPATEAWLLAAALPQPASCTADAVCSAVTPAANMTARAGQGELAASEVLTMPQYVTAPDLLPRVTSAKTGAAVAEGSIFLSPWEWNPASGRYVLIVNDHAELVYYRRLSDSAHDFKRQFNGYLTYYNQADFSFKVLNSSYQEIDTWRAGNGYYFTDLHELKLLPNGHALLMIYDSQPYDLSPYGGPVDAHVIGLIIQELDENKNVVFEWNSRDHIAITDTQENINTANLDYVHGNAIELDQDGNLLISSRHLSEITKIDRNTGDIIWRLGGKQNQFTFIGDQTLPDVGAFSYQHDIRRLPNGNVTLFDNANQFYAANIHSSRGVEYKLDEVAKTATLVAEYRESPDVISQFMGNVQHLDNGNTLVGWGGGFLPPAAAPPGKAVTEFGSNGEVVMNLDFVGSSFVSYRAFRFPWHGYPTTPPTLVAVTNTLPISLYYSWNGATEVVSYTVAGGALAEAMTDFAVQPKTGFEEQTGLENAPQGACFFRVTPYDNLGQENLASNIAYLGDDVCPTGFTASATEAGSRALVLPNASGPATVTLSIAAGAVTTTTVFALSPVTPTAADLPPDKAWTGVGFTVGAYDPAYLAGGTTTAAAQAAPLQFTIDYRSLPVPHVATLSVARWDAAQGQWNTDGITLLSNDTLHRRLTFSVTSPDTFALLADNQAPVSANSWVLTDEDTPYPFQPANFAYYDGDGDPIQSILIASLPTSGTLTYAGEPITTGQVITAGAVSQLVFVPPPDANGLPYTSFGFSVGDGFAASPAYTATILVRPVNDAPVAVDDMLSLITTERRMVSGEPFPLDVLANDYDVDGDRLRIVDVSDSRFGALSIMNNQLLYVPHSSSFDLDMVTYTITDDHGGEATATVRLSGAAQRLFLPNIQAQGVEKR